MMEHDVTYSHGYRDMMELDATYSYGNMDGT
jgi:hypothetical protein